MVSVTDRVILITGTGSGIGHALATRFTDDGALVVGCDLPDKVEASPSVSALALEADVRDPAQLAGVVSAAVAKFGRVDALIANAGLGRRASIEDGKWSDFTDVVDVNLYGVMHSIRAVLPAMRNQGAGRIVSLVSRNAEFCPPKLAAYNMTKAAVIALTRTLAHELRGTDILANNLIPGPSKTPMNPNGTIDPGDCYPTAKLLVTLPSGGPAGRTFYEEHEYPVYAKFSSDGTAAVVHDNERARLATPS